MRRGLYDLKGSETRDAFKSKHKQLPDSFYACDTDLNLVSKNPPGIIATLDYKTPRDSVTFTEVIAYNETIETHPVYIVQSDDPNNGPFAIYEYVSGDWRPDPPIVEMRFVTTCTGWPDFTRWENELRKKYCAKHKR